jgi:hypothetical protein
METTPTTNNAPGDPLTVKSQVLETGASAIQNFAPLKHICAHLNAFHAYASEPTRCVEANHYCTHLNEGTSTETFPRLVRTNQAEDVRQCVLYDSPEKNARLIGVEYMISPRLYKTLPKEERKLWHSHVFEVKSGMLIMPKPAGVPDAVWEIAETKEMEDVIGIYGKVFHLWQVDRGDKLPMGEPQLMTSFVAENQMEFEKLVGERDKKFGSDWKQKKAKREYIQEPEIHSDADWTWKSDEFKKRDNKPRGADGGCEIIVLLDQA